MSKKLGEFIHALLLKAGQSSDADPIKNFFAAPELMNIDVPDELALALDNNLLTVKDAQNNHPAIKKHYDAQALDAVDRMLGETLADIPEEEKRSIFEEKSTYKRIPLAFSKIKELEAKKFESSAKPDKDALNEIKQAYEKQVNDLAFKLRQRDEEIAGVRKDADKRVNQIHVGSELTGLLSGYKTIYDELPPAAKKNAIKALIDGELTNNEAEFYLDDKGNFDLRKKDGTSFLGDNHQAIKPQSFIESILSKNKLLKVTTNDPNQGDNTQQTNGQRNPDSSRGGGATKNHALQSLTKQAREDYQKSAANSILG